MTFFTESDYDVLHSLVFRPDYPGYKPAVTEIPNGDGKADTLKRYAHVAPKYWDRMVDGVERRTLIDFYHSAHALATYVARSIDIPGKYWPRPEYGALRILDYPPGAGSNLHEDFDLFTLMMYRDDPSKFVAYDTSTASTYVTEMRRVNTQAHLGQIGAAIGLGAATPHEVLPSDKRQKSIVYFAIPSHKVRLPSTMVVNDAGERVVTEGPLVKDWLNERMQRSRTEFKAYE